MNKSLLMLEYDKILNLLANEVSNEDSKEKILNIRPFFGDIENCKKVSRETDDAYKLSCKFGSPSFSGLKNIVQAVKRSKIGAILSEEELLTILSILKIIENLKKYKNQFLEFETSLDVYFNKIMPNTYLKDKIEKSILPSGEISDSASENLYNIRQKIKEIGAKSRESLENIVRNPKYQKYLQNSAVTIRDSRFVLPVRSEYRSEIPGIVHDISSSGSTVFIEPMFAIESNNNLRSLKIKEKREIENILREVSAKVSDFSHNIIESYNALVDLDVIFAKANFGYKLKGCTPNFNTCGKINLKKARHPLIPKNFVVPIDVNLGITFNSLIITGSNTGGKTVVLKTLGLLCAMATSGLMIPAECGSEVCVFDNIFADIGEEQSIEQSLSTFSSHIKNIVYILNRVTDKTLVLLDEIGAGTDPFQGAAIARAIIESIQKTGAKMVVTTHYRELKEYAIVEDNIENACCEFDISNLKPTYKLVIGVPGNSYAFLISEKLGVRKSIIDRAKTLVGHNDADIENAIRSLDNTKKSLETQLKSAENDREKYEKLKKDLENKLLKFEKNKNREIEKYKLEAKLLLSKVRAQTDDLMDEIRKARKNRLNISSEKKRDINSKIKNIESIADPINEAISEETISNLKPGDSVLVLGINKKGIVVSCESENNLIVQVENVKLNLSKNKIKIAKAENMGKNKGGVSKKTKSIKDINVHTEIDLRGKNALEATSELEMFIDSCIVAKIGKITIIHGKGSGVLRREISRFLTNNRFVSNFRLGTFGEGDTGVTIASLKL